MRMHRIIVAWAILLMTIPSFAQQFEEAIRQRNMARAFYEQGDFAPAVLHYDSAAREELKNPGPFYPFVASCYEMMGSCFENMDDYIQAVPSYDRSLRYYVLAENFDEGYDMLSAIIAAHEKIISLDLPVTWDQHRELANEEIHFRVEEVLNEKIDTVWARLAAGLNDGIYSGAKGEALGVYSSDSKSRGNIPLGKAVVLTASNNEAIVRINLANPDQADKRLYPGDMVMLPVRIPANESPSIFIDLVKLNIDFLNNFRDPLYHPRHLFYFDNRELETLMLKKMMEDVFETLEVIRPDAPNQPAFTQSTLSGRFKGLNLLESMEITQPDDIKAFLEFVKSFPGKYMGHSWKINETYATWIINNTPVSAGELKEMLIYARDDQAFVSILSDHVRDLVDGDFFTVWQNESERFAVRGYFNEALSINSLLFRIARALDSADMTGWAYFNLGYILDQKQDYPSASEAYGQGKDFFIQTGNLKGASYCTNNMAKIENSQGNYSGALAAYDESFRLKLLQQEGNPSENLSESIARSLEGMGNSYYYMGDYDKAAETFNQCVSYYRQANSLSGLKSEASVYGWIGNIFSKTGDFGESMVSYEMQLGMMRDLGDLQGEADALDNIAYIHSLTGETRKASEIYLQAYEIKVKLDDKNGAGFSLSNAGQTYWTLGDFERQLLPILRQLSSGQLPATGKDRPIHGRSWETSILKAVIPPDHWMHLGMQ